MSNPLHHRTLQEPDVLSPIISGCVSCRTISNISFKSNNVSLLSLVDA